MEVMTIEASAFKEMKGWIEEIKKTVTELAAENKKLKDNRLMDINETMEYTGFGKTWLLNHKEDIGYAQIGISGIRFYKENIDQYFKKHIIQRKH